MTSHNTNKKAKSWQHKDRRGVNTCRRTKRSSPVSVVAASGYDERVEFFLAAPHPSLQHPSVRRSRCPQQPNCRTLMRVEWARFESFSLSALEKWNELQRASYKFSVGRQWHKQPRCQSRPWEVPQRIVAAEKKVRQLSQLYCVSLKHHTI